MENSIANLTPREFEDHVENMISSSGIGLEEFEVSKREKIQGSDGEYEIDVLARFKALNSSFLVLIECKHHKNPIKREVVQILHSRMNSIGAQKGMIFSSVKFQRGALEYAKKHNIALVKVTDSEPEYFMRAQDTKDIPMRTRKGAWLVQHIEENKTKYTTLGLYQPEIIFKSLGIKVDTEDLIEVGFEKTN